MKTRYCTILALMILSACSRNMDSLEKGIEEMSFVAAIEQPKDSSATKTLLGGSSSDASRQVLWCASDEICVATGDKSSKFVNVTSSSSSTATFEGSISPADTYYAAYPYSYVTGFSSNGFSLNLPSTQNYRKDGFDDDSFPMVAKTTGGTFNFLNLCGIFVLNLTGDKSIESLTFSAHKDDGSEIPVAGTAKVSMDYASVPSLSLTGTTHPSVTLVCAEPVTLSPSSPTSFHIILPPGSYPSFSIIVYATDGSKMQITSSKPMTINRSSRTVATSRIICTNGINGSNEDFGKGHSFTDLFETAVPFNNETYVDLGLSVNWATCNLGASKPEQYGGYYQWAGLKDVTSTSIYLDWSNCPYHTGSSSSTGWTKYVPSDKSSYWSGSGSPDNKTVLDPEDDVAHVKLGGKWRMPTDAEWTELMNTDNCIWTWTTQNGEEGYKVTSKKNGNSIFLPAAGCRYFTRLSNVGSYGYYWSSSLHTRSPNNACYLYFYSGYVSRSIYNRYNGQSVRPVYGDRVSVTGVSLSKTSLSLEIGETYTLSATVAPANATEKAVTWSSGNTSVATVDASGKVTAVGAGTATITAATTDGGKTATCSIRVVSPMPKGIRILTDHHVDFKYDNLSYTPRCYDSSYSADKLKVTDAEFNQKILNVLGLTSNQFGERYNIQPSDIKMARISGKDTIIVDISLPKGVSWEALAPEMAYTNYNIEIDLDKYVATNSSGEVILVFTPKDEYRDPIVGMKFTFTVVGHNHVPIVLTLNSDYLLGRYNQLYAGSSAIAMNLCQMWDNIGAEYVNGRYSSLIEHFEGYSVPELNDGIIRFEIKNYSADKVSFLGPLGGDDFLTGITISNCSYVELTKEQWKKISTSSYRMMNGSNGPEINLLSDNIAGDCYVLIEVTQTCGFDLSKTVGYYYVVFRNDFVDLGLSVKWATCNLGATSPEQYGGHYQWAGIQDVTSTSIDLDWSNCPYYTGSDYNTGWTKYVPSNKSSYWSGSGSPDNKKVLDPEDDVAHVKLGGKWRMPTDAEWTELMNTDNCTWTWTTQNGVKGYKVTSKKNGNSIFLPAAGYRYYGSLYNAGSDGYYWSSSLYTSYPSSAYYLYFYSDYVYTDYYGRCYGRSVRPVSE